jgi:hypothetical protein
MKDRKTQHPFPAIKVQRKPPSNPKVPVWIWGLLGGVVMLLVLILVTSSLLRDTWEVDHLVQIRELEERASALVYKGKRPEALAIYEELFRLIDNREMKTPLGRETIERARTSYDQLKVELEREFKRSSPPTLPESESSAEKLEGKDSHQLSSAPAQLPRWLTQAEDSFEVDLAAWNPTLLVSLDDGIQHLLPREGRRYLKLPVILRGTTTPQILDRNSMELSAGKFIGWEIDEQSVQTLPSRIFPFKRPDGLTEEIELPNAIPRLTDRLEISRSGTCTWLFNPLAIGARVRSKDGGYAWLYEVDRHALNDPQDPNIQEPVYLYYKILGQGYQIYEDYELSSPSLLLKFTVPVVEHNSNAKNQNYSLEGQGIHLECKFLTASQADALNKTSAAPWQRREEFQRRWNTSFRKTSDSIKSIPMSYSSKEEKKQAETQQRKFAAQYNQWVQVCWRKLGIFEKCLINKEVSLASSSASLTLSEDTQKSLEQYLEQLPIFREQANHARQLPVAFTSPVPVRVYAIYELFPDEAESLTLKYSKMPVLTLDLEALSKIPKQVESLKTSSESLESLLEFISDGHPLKSRMVARLSVEGDPSYSISKTIVHVEGRPPGEYGVYRSGSYSAGMLKLWEQLLKSPDEATRRIVLRYLLKHAENPDIQRQIQLANQES